jgi:hypothetical protein
MNLVGPDGAPIQAEMPVVGINLYEADGGDTSAEIIKKIELMRAQRQPAGTLVAAPGQVTLGVLQEIELFNKEAYAGQELSESDKDTIRKAVARRQRKGARALENARKTARGQDLAVAKMRNSNA